jgi:hypothetical protein
MFIAFRTHAMWLECLRCNGKISINSSFLSARGFLAWDSWVYELAPELVEFVLCGQPSFDSLSIEAFDVSSFFFVL